MGLVILFLGFLYYALLYHVLLYFLKQNVNKIVPTEADAFTIAERVVSAAQAVAASLAGVIIVLSCSGKIMEDKHWLVNTYAWFALPYFYFDVYAMYHTYWSKHRSSQSKHLILNCKVFLKAEPLMMVHHVILPVIFFPVVVWYRGDLGDFFLGCLYLFELVIPFISTRAILKQLKMEDTRFYTMNGVFLIVTYILCRILIFPFMYWKFSQSEHIAIYQVPGRIPMKCNVACLGLMCLQIYWLILILKVTAQTLKKRKQKQRMREKKNVIRNGSTNSVCNR